MSTLSATPETAASPVLTPPQLRPASFEDYEKIRQLVLFHACAFPPLEDWRSLWLENPLHARLGKDVPIGWVLETGSGEMVGTMGTVRTLYTYRGTELVNAVGRAWFVKTPYRGFALQLMGEYFGQSGVDLFINNTVSKAALGPFSELSSRVPVGSWETMPYWITDYHEFGRKALRKLHLPVLDALAYSAGAALRLKDLTSNKRLPKVAGFDIDVTDRFDSRFDAFWNELLRERSGSLLALRNRSALSWHFAIPMRRQRIWIVTASRSNRLRGYCVLTRQDHGFRLPALPCGQGTRALRVADYQSLETDDALLPAMLEVALRISAASGVAILESLGSGVPKMHAFDECAPHRRKLENWKFFYRAADSGLDRELSDPKVWDPSAFDGDATFE